MTEVETAKLAEAANLPAIGSLIFKLQRIYGATAPDVFENVIRGSAISVGSGGGGEGWSMLTDLGWKRGKRSGASGTRYWERSTATDGLTDSDALFHRGSQKFSAVSMAESVSMRQCVSAGIAGDADRPDSSPALGPAGDSLDDFH